MNNLIKHTYKGKECIKFSSNFAGVTAIDMQVFGEYYHAEVTLNIRLMGKYSTEKVIIMGKEALKANLMLSENEWLLLLADFGITFGEI